MLDSKSDHNAPAEKGQTALVKRSHEAKTLDPAVQAAIGLKDYAERGAGNLDLVQLVRELEEQVEATRKGDLGRAESMLAAQAHTLDAIFNSLARRAANQNRLDHIEAHLKLALKAQSQCRSTLEALAEIKSPRAVSFVRQANVAHGNQQVNNHEARAREEIE